MDRVALVIGNSAYQHVGSLKNPKNDAEDMACVLEKLNFKVEKYLDITQDESFAAINTFLRELDEYSTGLLYYAGHGMQIDGENYIIPIDCELSDKAKTINSCVSLNDYLKRLSAYKGKTNICILDACRDNPFAMDRGFSSGFSEFRNQPKGTIIAYSTSPDCTASDGKESNGLYTQVLKDVIQVPNLKIEDMFKAVRIKVSELSNDSQISWDHSSLMGDFYFSVIPMSVNKSVSDVEIYDFIESRAKNYGSYLEDINDIECLPYIDAYNKFQLPVIKLLRAYSRVQYAKSGKYFSDATIDQINIEYINSWGFKQVEGRWYYKNNYVEMGDPLPLPPELSPLVPLEGKELKIGGNIKAERQDKNFKFVIHSNIPAGTPLIITLKKGKRMAQAKMLAGEVTSVSPWISIPRTKVWNGQYKLEITCPAHNLLPKEVKDIFGERSRNIIGKWVMFDPICGNMISFNKKVYVRDDRVLVLDE
jgi:hypothetical protein